MGKKLFAGMNAVDSILLVANSTNDKLLERAFTRTNKHFNHYEPWMCLPTEMLYKDIKYPFGMGSRGRFMGCGELAEVKFFTHSLNAEGKNIPSVEKYDFIVSDVDESMLNNFNEKLREAEATLIELFPYFKPLVENLVQLYVPMENPQQQHDFDYGMSVMWMKGVIFYEKKQFPSLNRRVENLAHEIAHQIINNYQLNDFLIEGDLNRKVFSGIRKVERPAVMAYHGAAALCHMLLVARACNDEKRSNELHDSLVKTLESLRPLSFTPIGQKIFEEMHEFL
jgi:hypothetical protein